MEKEYCIFIAQIIDDSVLEDITLIRDKAKQLYHVELKPSLKMNNINNTNNIDNINNIDNTNNIDNKLNQCGIPTNIKSSSLNNDNNTIEILTKELNDAINENSQQQLFIVNMEEYDKLIDNFYQSHHNIELKLPKLEGINLLSIVQACSITATEEYMRKHCVDIAQKLKNNIENNTQ